MADFHDQINQEMAREEIRYRRQLALEKKRREHRRKLFFFSLGVVLFAAVTAGIVALSLSRGEKEPPSSNQDGDDPPTQNEDGPITPAVTVPDWVKQDLLPLNEYSRPGTPLTQVTHVVVHYVGNPGTTAQQNRNYFESLATTHETSASSHFVVGLEGEIIQCVPLDEWAYCTSQANAYSISVEVCHPDEDGKFTDVTVQSLVKLLRWLCDTYGIDREHLIRHYDVTGKICPKWYVDHPEDWEALKDMVLG